MAIKVEEKEDGSFDITWNENDPHESMFNDWTEEDFIRVITEYLEQIADESSTSCS